MATSMAMERLDVNKKYTAAAVDVIVIEDDTSSDAASVSESNDEVIVVATSSSVLNAAVCDDAVQQALAMAAAVSISDKTMDVMMEKSSEYKRFPKRKRKLERLKRHKRLKHEETQAFPSKKNKLHAKRANNGRGSNGRLRRDKLDSDRMVISVKEPTAIPIISLLSASSDDDDDDYAPAIEYKSGQDGKNLWYRPSLHPHDTAVALSESRATPKSMKFVPVDDQNTTKKKRLSRKSGHRLQRTASVDNRSHDHDDKRTVVAATAVASIQPRDKFVIFQHLKQKKVPKSAQVQLKPCCASINNDPVPIDKVVVHPTAWRQLRFAKPVVPHLLVAPESQPPFAKLSELPLNCYDESNRLHCYVAPKRSAPSSSNRFHHATHNEDQVVTFVNELLPHIDRCWKNKTRQIISDSRDQTQQYLRGKKAQLNTLHGDIKNIDVVPLPVSDWERALVKSLTSTLEMDESASKFSICINQSDESERWERVSIRPRCLQRVQPLCRSVTVIRVKSNVRVDDDPIVAHKRKSPSSRLPASQPDETPDEPVEVCSRVRSALDDEASEYILRGVVATFGGSDHMLSLLCRWGFEQPCTDYTELLKKQAEYPSTKPAPLLHKMSNDTKRFEGTLDGSHNAHGERREEEAAASFRDLFCRKCYHYDCQHHGIEQPVQHPRVDPKQPSLQYSPLALLQRSGSRDAMRDPSEYLSTIHLQWASSLLKSRLSAGMPCGNKCFQHKIEPTSTTSTAMMTVMTTMTMMMRTKRMMQIFGDNPCLIAALLGDGTTCSEIHNQLQNAGNHQPALGKASKRRSANSIIASAGGEHRPCDHNGPCQSAMCTCYRLGNWCEKSCGCSQDCPNRFPGCKCPRGKCLPDSCACFKAGRECSPDSCNTCGACEVGVLPFDNVRQKMPAHSLGICCNMSVSRGLQKKIGITRSPTHGWGAFALEHIGRMEFVCEYAGAVVSQDEAERRGTSYASSGTNYLFDLNEDTVVDAMRESNKSRYINHSASDPNCAAQIVTVNGDNRVGIWSTRVICIGEELLFDYGHTFNFE